MRGSAVRHDIGFLALRIGSPNVFDRRVFSTRVLVLHVLVSVLASNVEDYLADSPGVLLTESQIVSRLENDLRCVGFADSGDTKDGGLLAKQVLRNYLDWDIADTLE